MKYQFTSTYEIDVAAERRRIAKAFRSPKHKGARDRQLAVLDALEAKNLVLVWKLYDKLPYCKINEISEKEYVGLWMFEMGSRGVKSDPKLID